MRTLLRLLTLTATIVSLSQPLHAQATGGGGGGTTPATGGGTGGGGTGGAPTGGGRAGTGGTGGAPTGGRTGGRGGVPGATGAPGAPGGQPGATGGRGATGGPGGRGGGAAAPAPVDPAQQALYQKFLDSFRGDSDQQKTAYDTGKEYIGKYAEDRSAGNGQVVTFIRDWISKYDQATLEFNCKKSVTETPAQALAPCQLALATATDSLGVYLQMVAAGVNSSSTGKALYGDAASAATKALELIGAGKTTPTWVFGTSAADATGGLNYYLAIFSLDTAPATTVASLTKVAQSTTAFAKQPTAYQILAVAIQNAELRPALAEYKTNFEGKPESAESKAMTAKINDLLDRVIDAYARAAALSETEARYANLRTQVMTTLTALYKQRHANSDAGLTEFIAGVLAKPLPVSSPPPGE